MKGNDYRDQNTCLVCKYFDYNRSYNDIVELAECWCTRGMTEHEEKLVSYDIYGLTRVAREFGSTSSVLRNEGRSIRELHQVKPSGVCEYYNDTKGEQDDIK